VVDTNIVFEDDLIKAFAWSMQGYEAWKWYCNFKPKEIKSFPPMMKRFQRNWIWGYEEVGDIYVFIGMQGRMKENINDLVT
jgi:hypothetical protein